METNDLRASDEDREHAGAMLRAAYVDGRLTLAEFTTRLDTALTAETRGQLDQITHDIGLPATTTATATAATPAPRAPAANGQAWLVAILTHNERRGRWRMPGATNIISVLGSSTIDLRRAEIGDDEVVINTVSVMGSLRIIAPLGVQVDLEDISILGSSRDTRPDAQPLPGAPRVRVRGVHVMGSVTVVEDAGDSDGFDRQADVRTRPMERRQQRRDDRLQRRSERRQRRRDRRR